MPQDLDLANPRPCPLWLALTNAFADLEWLRIRISFFPSGATLPYLLLWSYADPLFPSNPSLSLLLAFSLPIPTQVLCENSWCGFSPLDTTL